VDGDGVTSAIVASGVAHNAQPGVRVESALE
jgi:hypothetical protein